MLRLLAKMASATVKIDGADAVERSMALLSPRTRRVIELRYGLKGESEHTLAEIAQTLNLTKMRVCQLEQSALRILSKGRSVHVDLQ